LHLLRRSLIIYQICSAPIHCLPAVGRGAIKPIGSKCRRYICSGGEKKIIPSLLLGEGPDNSLPLDGGGRACLPVGRGGGEKEIEKIPLPLVGEGVGEGEKR